ncbi:ArsR family transcriptional regulator [Pseudenhygromyxa sp. WMMC2535]|uniref:ArsR/SmtB family transcription factor n=1 Tax=Pseudenhygromyxa sp. WMMC2535 TaxID=2712867 RepID=UPI001553BF1B|nr:rhodanese-like domain-containing protein [Pseudenhygromyxa sp. WMMC2535]NVB39894.1 ArsR family transcriptional regulator [Pseudenhygromyxa sp. WMMC2535]
MTEHEPTPARICYQQAAEVASALASAPRLRLMNLIAQTPRGVDELAALMGQSKATTSAQLKVLRDAGLLIREARGRRRLHRVASDAALALFLAHRDFALNHSARVRERMRRAEEQAPLIHEGPRELAVAVNEGTTRMLDLRPAKEWLFAHPAGAQNLPFETLDEQLEGLSRDAHYAVFCRGPVCAKAIEGTAKLRAFGLDARRVPEGIADWRLAGLPVTTQTTEEAA